MAHSTCLGMTFQGRFVANQLNPKFATVVKPHHYISLHNITYSCTQDSHMFRAKLPNSRRMFGSNLSASLYNHVSDVSCVSKTKQWYVCKVILHFNFSTCIGWLSLRMNVQCPVASQTKPRSGWSSRVKRDSLLCVRGFNL